MQYTRPYNDLQQTTTTNIMQESLANALKLNGTDVDGRAIEVQKSLPRGSRPPKGSSKQSSAATPAPAPTRPTLETPTLPAAAAAAVSGSGSATEKGAREGEGEGGVSVSGDGGDGSESKAKKKKKKDKGEVVVAEGGAGAGGAIKWPVHPTTVFVRGLGLTATSKDLREAFVGVGEVVEARVMADKKTHELKVR